MNVYLSLPSSQETRDDSLLIVFPTGNKLAAPLRANLTSNSLAAP